MAAFGEEAIDRLIAEAQQPTDRLEELYQQVLVVTGRAQDPDKLVTVECSSQGVTGLEIDPRALRWGSRRLSETMDRAMAERGRIERDLDR